MLCVRCTGGVCAAAVLVVRKAKRGLYAPGAQTCAMGAMDGIEAPSSGGA